jgi:ribonucleoside-diphosphate reductase beta chain
MSIDPKIFNETKTDYENPSLFLGEQEMGLVDTVNKQYPEIWSLYKTMKSLDWDESEFNYSSCNVEFKTCAPATYDMMIKTLSFQWEADSIAARSIAPIVAPFVSSSELWAAWGRISDNECIHSATYSEIVRNSFDDPNIVLHEVLKVREAMSRLAVVSETFSHAYQISHKYALGLCENDQETYNAIFMFTVALLVLERIQFMASFAVTFAICDTGLFQPIGKAVQKIAQDELEVHVELDKAVLKNELKTERGRIAFEQCKDKIQNLIDEVVSSELEWVDYLFSEGRELVGMNADVLKQWVLFCSKDVYHFMKLSSPRPLPKNNPLKFMENWLDISKTQASPQEQDNGQYKVGIMTRNDSTEEFDVEF